MSVPSTNTDLVGKTRRPLAEFWSRFLRQKVALVSLSFLGLLILAATFAPWVAPYDPGAPDYMNVLQGPSAQHWAGTDTYGRDIFSRIIWGARISLAVGFLSVSLGAVSYTHHRAHET
jgi:glutathione transport system permease protein